MVICLHLLEWNLSKSFIATSSQVPQELTINIKRLLSKLNENYLNINSTIRIASGGMQFNRKNHPRVFRANRFAFCIREKKTMSNGRHHIRICVRQIMCFSHMDSKIFMSPPFLCPSAADAPPLRHKPKRCLHFGGRAPNATSVY